MIAQESCISGVPKASINFWWQASISCCTPGCRRRREIVLGCGNSAGRRSSGQFSAWHAQQTGRSCNTAHTITSRISRAVNFCIRLGLSAGTNSHTIVHKRRRPCGAGIGLRRSEILGLTPQATRLDPCGVEELNKSRPVRACRQTSPQQPVPPTKRIRILRRGHVKKTRVAGPMVRYAGAARSLQNLYNIISICYNSPRSVAAVSLWSRGTATWGRNRVLIPLREIHSLGQWPWDVRCWLA